MTPEQQRWMAQWMDRLDQRLVLLEVQAQQIHAEHRALRRLLFARLAAPGWTRENMERLLEEAVELERAEIEKLVARQRLIARDESRLAEEHPLPPAGDERLN